MPNWCDNHLRVTGDNAELKRFVKAITSDDDSIQILKNLLPFPSELEGKDITDKDGNAIARAFTDGGYSWCLDVWGTKWADCETEILVEEDDNLVIRYQTAWSPALEGLKRVSVLFPTLQFQSDWVEEGNQSLGAALHENGNEQFVAAPYEAMPEYNDFVDGDDVDWQAYQDAVDDLLQSCIEALT